MKIKVFFLIKLILILICNYSYSNTNVNFSTNITTEFPSTAEYNNFKSNLTDAFEDAFIIRNSIYAAAISFFPNIIIDEVNNFSFGGSMSYLLLPEKNKSKLEDIKYQGVAEYVGSLKFFIGTSLFKNFDIFLISGKFDSTNIPLILTFLWKFYSKSKNGKKKRIIKPHFVRDIYGKLKLKKIKTFYEDTIIRSQKFFLAPSFGFYYKNISGEDIYMNFNGSYSFNNGILTLPNKQKITNTKDIIIFLDISLKYTLRIKWFNFNTSLGVSLHFYNIEEKYKIENINVDYSSFGSPTGIVTDLFVDFKEKWVNIMPHLSIGFSFNLAKWIKVSALTFSLIFVPSLERLVISLDAISIYFYF